MEQCLYKIFWDNFLIEKMHYYNFNLAEKNIYDIIITIFGAIVLIKMMFGTTALK